MARSVSIMKLLGSISNTFLGMLSRCRCQRREKGKCGNTLQPLSPSPHHSTCLYASGPKFCWMPIWAGISSRLWGLATYFQPNLAAQSPPRMFDAFQKSTGGSSPVCDGIFVKPKVAERYS